MKKFLIGFCVLTTAVATTQAQVKSSTVAKPKTSASKTMISAKKVAVSPGKASIDSFSYAVGLNIGATLKKQGINDLKFSDMQKAINDMLNGKTPLLTEQQENIAIQKKFQAVAEKKAAKTKADAAAFLANNAKRPGVITLPDGLQYEVLKKSDLTTGSPKPQDTVVANYAGTLIDGTEFDNSYKRGEPLKIGVSSVIKGWTEILQMMHPGDKWKVYIPSDLGYGDMGQGSIPGGATLIFDMELLQVIPGK